MLERIINPAKKTIGAALVCGALAVGSLLGSCRDNERNHNPVIKKIEDQVVMEGESISLDLNKYISDPDGDKYQAKLIKGPGIIVDNQFYYQDQIDDNTVDEEYTILFRVTDGNGGKAQRSFKLIQQDNYVPRIVVRRETLSSGLEALIIGNDPIALHPFDVSSISVAVNSRDEPMIIYYRELSSYTLELKYAELKNGFWGAGGIGFVGNGGGSYSNSMVIDSQNKAHVSFNAYRILDGEVLYYASSPYHPIYTNRHWEMQLVDDNKQVGLGNCIAQDSQGGIHISHWCSRGYANLRYSSNNSGVWVNEVLDDVDWPQQTSIAIDALDNVHIAYVDYESLSYVLYHITNKSGSWRRTQVNSGLENPFLCIDSRGVKHIISASEGFFKVHMYHSTDQSGNWVTQNVITHDNQTQISEGLSGAIADDDSIMIAYILPELAAPDKLYFATNRTGNWRTYLLDDKSEHAIPSIAVDKKGDIHLVVVENMGGFTGILKYITFDPSQL